MSKSGVVLSVGVLLVFFATASAAIPWHRAYHEGLKLLEKNHYAQAVEMFETALREKSTDTPKVRAFGTIFIEYFPNRELGICYYHLGDQARARHYLELSKRQASSLRASQFLRKIDKEPLPPQTSLKETKPAPSREELLRVAPPEPADEVADAPAVLIGERLSLAVLPLESKGFGEEIGNMDVLDKMITGLVNVNRFKVVERAQLEKIIEEQKLGMSGILDAGTAARVGRGIGVDCVIVGSVTRSGNSVSIDARLIDTETAAILSAQDAYCRGVDLENISKMITTLAEKIKSDFPIVGGYVINVDVGRLTLDVGSQNGLRKGIKCHIYREGDSIVHPVSGKVIGKTIDQIAEIQVIDVYDSYSVAKVTKSKMDQIRNLDRVITK